MRKKPLIDFLTLKDLTSHPRELKHIIINDNLYMLKYLNNGITSIAYEITNMKNKVLVVSSYYDFQTKIKRNVFLKPKRKHIPHYTELGIIQDLNLHYYYVDMCEKYKPISEKNPVLKYLRNIYSCYIDETLEEFKQRFKNEKSIYNAMKYIAKENDIILKSTNKKRKKYTFDVHRNNLMVDAKNNIILLDIFC